MATNHDHASEQPAPWQADILGEGFEQRTLSLTPDSQGEVVATLVRSLPKPPPSPQESSRVPAWLRRLFPQTRQQPAAPRLLDNVDVLYVHGWKDYFFQRHIADFFTERGAAFHALDLRKYGRSLLPHQTPGYTTSLNVYDEDIEAALTVIGHGQDTHPERRLLLMGHSTGGLTLSLWADRHRGRASGLILNSPWLELQARSIGRQVLTPVVDLRSRIDPDSPLTSVNRDFYSRSIDIEQDGEWTYNHDWRPNESWPITAAWASAILGAHARVAAGIDVAVPVLSLLSRKDNLQPRWSPSMLTSDTVLKVDLVARRSLNLGDFVTVGRIDDALHDVFLSREDVRARAFDMVDAWLKGWNWQQLVPN